MLDNIDLVLVHAVTVDIDLYLDLVLFAGLVLITEVVRKRASSASLPSSTSGERRRPARTIRKTI